MICSAEHVVAWCHACRSNMPCLPQPSCFVCTNCGGTADDHVRESAWQAQSLFSMLKPRTDWRGVMLSTEDSEFIDSLFPGAAEFREVDQGQQCAS